MSTYEVWLCRDTGDRIEEVSQLVNRIDYVKSVNTVGSFVVELNAIIDTSLLLPDRQIQIWRAPSGGSLYLDFVGFLRSWQFVRFPDQTAKTILTGPDAKDLLNRRIIAYDADDSKTSVSSVAVDDAMKQLVRENLGSSATDSDRDISGFGFTVEGNSSQGVAISKGFAWRPLLKVLQDMNAQSKTDGNEVFFDIAIGGISADFVPTFVFQTKVGQPGADRTQGVEPVIFGEDWGNLESPSLQQDHRDEANYIYTAGQGEGSNRDISEVSVASRIGLSIFGRKEKFKDARNVDQGDTTTLGDVANEQLAQSRPTETFSGRLLDTGQAVYGRDWNWGDKVTAIAFNKGFDGVIRIVRVTVSSDGQENIVANLEGINL